MFFTAENLHMDWESVSIDFSGGVDRGKMLVIVGHSGSGKSTILKMMAGLLPPGKNARITLDGADITKTPAGKRHIGMVFQSPALFSHMRIVDNAAYSLAAAGMRRKERYEKASEWLSRFGLSGFEKRWPDSLSGGEAQRVSLVRTLIAEPRLVLFDEPFSALDAPLRKKLSEELRQWQKELGFAGIVVTHDIEEARALGDEITVMKAGKQVWSGLPADFEESLLV